MGVSSDDVYGSTPHGDEQREADHQEMSNNWNHGYPADDPRSEGYEGSDTKDEK